MRQEHDAEICEQLGSVWSELFFSDAFSIQNSQSFGVFGHRMLRLSHPGNGTGSFNLQDGEFHPRKACLECSCVDARGDARFTSL